MLTLAVALACAPCSEAQTVVKGTPSRPDTTGAYTVTLDLEHLMPVAVRGQDAWQQTFAYRLPANVTVRRVRTFYGVDRGDLFEGHLIVQAEDYDLHRTSPHHEAPGIYDAYTQSDGLKYRTAPGGGWLYVHSLCRATTAAPIACHIGLILEVAP